MMDLSTLAGQRAHYGSIKHRLSPAPVRVLPSLPAVYPLPFAIVYNDTRTPAEKLCDWCLARRGQPLITSTIQSATAVYFGLSRADLTGPRRLKKFMLPRQIAAYLVRTITTRSLPEIALAFGGRHHTSILHATRKIMAPRLIDSELDAEIREIEHALKGVE